MPINNLLNKNVNEATDAELKKELSDRAENRYEDKLKTDIETEVSKIETEGYEFLNSHGIDDATMAFIFGRKAVNKITEETAHAKNDSAVVSPAKNVIPVATVSPVRSILDDLDNVVRSIVRHV